MFDKIDIKEINSLKPFLVLFLIITLFVFITSFTVFYTTENFSSACGCELPLWVIIVSISSFGLFSGLLVFYVLSTNPVKQETDKKIDVSKILDILDSDESKVLKILINNKGEVIQSKLSKELGYERVKTSRILSKMVAGGVIRKEKEGMTNRVILDEKIIKFKK